MEPNFVDDDTETNEDVEVWCRSTNHWSQGFTVAAVDREGVKVRRVSDGAVLPTPFPRSEVRHPHR